MKILYLSANPEFVKNPAEPELLEKPTEEYSEYTKLDLWPELDELTNAFFEQRMMGNVQLEVVPQANASDIVRYVERFKPNIVHFSGHGEKERLVISDEEYFDGEQKSSEWLKQTLKDKGVDILLLNCCWSATFVDNLKDTVGLVIGAEQRLSSELAQQFTKRFYGCLQEGLTVGDAYLEAQKISPQYKSEPQAGGLWDKPLLIAPATDEFSVNMRAHEARLKELDSNLKPDLHGDYLKVVLGIGVATCAYFFLNGLVTENSFIDDLFDSYKAYGQHKDWLDKEPIALLIIIAEKPMARILSYRWAKAAIAAAMKVVEFAQYSQVYSEKHRIEQRVKRVIDWLANRQRDEEPAEDE